VTPLKVLLNSYHSGANAWFALAEERSLFAAEGLDVSYTAGPGAYRAAAAMAEGEFDLTFGDMGSLTRIAAEAQDGTLGPKAIYMVHHRSPSAIAVVAEGPIHAPLDLEGRRLITHLSDVAYRGFPAYARLAGLDQEAVEIAISDDPMAAMLQTMLAGEADGVFGYVSSQKAVLRQADPALAARLRFLPFPDVAPDLYGSAIIASHAALADKGEALRAFLRAMNRALLEAVVDPSEAVEAALKRNGALDRAIEMDRWTGVIADELTHPEIGVIGFGAVDQGRLERASALLARTTPFARAPSAEDLFDPAFLPSRDERMRLAGAVLAAEAPVGRRA
jgi:NitT/TauT family transport system substrate-binding protein